MMTAIKKIVFLSFVGYLFLLTACDKLEKFNKIAKLEKKVSQYQDYDLQEKCSRKSNEFFESNFSMGRYDYQNHFNKNVNKCFVYVYTFNSSTVIAYLYDANKKQPIGAFYREGYDGNRCGDGICKNFPEWDKFVKRYMEDL